MSNESPRRDSSNPITEDGTQKMHVHAASDHRDVADDSQTLIQKPSHKIETNKEVPNSSIRPNDRVQNVGSKLSNRTSGVFFRHESVNFGSVQVGTISRLKLELCNCTDKEVCFNIIILLLFRDLMVIISFRS